MVIFGSYITLVFLLSGLDSLTGRVYKGHPCFYISYWTAMSRFNRTIITILQLLCIISYSLSKPAIRLQSSDKAVVVEGGKLQQVIDTQMSVELETSEQHRYTLDTHFISSYTQGYCVHMSWK